MTGTVWLWLAVTAPVSVQAVLTGVQEGVRAARRRPALAPTHLWCPACRPLSIRAALRRRAMRERVRAMRADDDARFFAGLAREARRRRMQTWFDNAEPWQLETLDAWLTLRQRELLSEMGLIVSMPYQHPMTRW